MWNSTCYDPSVADARFLLAGQNQSFCPVNEQAASHGYFPPRSLQESQADGNNRLNRAIQRKVLLAYIQYKDSAAVLGNDAPACFANYLHSTVCCRYACRCTKFFSLASHYDGCHNATCDICSTVWYNAVVDTFHPDFEHVGGGSGDSGQPTYGSSEAMQPLPKRLMLDNPTAPVSYNSEAGVELQPTVLDDSTIANWMDMNMEVNTELLPYPTEDPASAKEMNIELLPKPTEDCTGPKEMEEWSMEWISKLIEDSSNAKEMAESSPGPPEVAIAGYKVVETDGVGSHREDDIGFINVIDNARGHSNNALPSFSEELAAGCEEGET
ncbi:hypothetical protein J1N35_033121 [Gossypium stocksii]|uniref:Uncharacterized protein n=1 Tax=Gossypium stocksii TaxID=47602 RepID=A0A9D3ZN20_9ROSI|nr:hypothetical protein J1N35_033121 [Gossypium stocksii]